jgi:hypothetical protein
VLQEGAQHAFGPRNEVLRTVPPQAAVAPSKAGLKLVSATAE